MTATRAEAPIKELACLGLGGETVMPALLHELHALVPSYSNQFFWCDEKYQVNNFYDDNPEGFSAAPLFINEFLNKRECEVQIGFSQAMRDEQGIKTVEEFSKVGVKRWYEHDAYQTILRPLKYHHLLRTMVREQGRALGFLYLMRTDGEAKFIERDKKKLAGVLPYVAHALAPAAELQVPLVDSEDSGLIIVDLQGKVQHMSAQARKLLFLVKHARVSPKTTHADEETTLPPAVVQLCKNLVSVFTEKGGAVTPPVWSHQNAWGGFTFRAYWLDNSSASNSLIGITVQRQEPLPLKLMRQIEKLALSHRQMQLCLHLAAGHSYAAIARQLGVSENTVITHSRQVYTKLDVRKQSELVSKLLALCCRDTGNVMRSMALS